MASHAGGVFNGSTPRTHFCSIGIDLICCAWQCESFSMLDSLDIKNLFPSEVCLIRIALIEFPLSVST